jgi:tetratricopeptide (TPR) repeat protein
MGLGNSAYAAGDLDAAADAYRRVLQLRPDYAPAYNNLAQTLADRKQWEEAERLARRAIDIGGSHMDDYRATLQDILRNRDP